MDVVLKKPITTLEADHNAILQHLEFAGEGIRKIWIYTNHAEAVENCRKKRTSFGIVSKIHNLAREAGFTWGFKTGIKGDPRHSRIPGNEEVDQAARDRLLVIPIPFSTLFVSSKIVSSNNVRRQTKASPESAA